MHQELRVALNTAKESPGKGKGRTLGWQLKCSENTILKLLNSYKWKTYVNKTATLGIGHRTVED